MSPELKARLVDLHRALNMELSNLDSSLPRNDGVGEYTFNDLELCIQDANARIGRMEVVLGFLKETVDGDWK